MMNPIDLHGKKVAVLVESQYVPEEIMVYRERFSGYGAAVHFMSRLWNEPKATFVSEVEKPKTIPETLTVDIDFQNVRLEDYAAVIMAANYTSVRLRHFEPPEGEPVNAEMVKTAPAVDFYTKAMINPKIVKGALCHGLWILTPRPEFLFGRHVICHNVVLSDIVNTGAIFTDDPSGVVVDGDLVTGRTYHEASLFVDKIAEQIIRIGK
jgi:protease I